MNDARSKEPESVVNERISSGVFERNDNEGISRRLRLHNQAAVLRQVEGLFRSSEVRCCSRPLEACARGRACRRPARVPAVPASPPVSLSEFVSRSSEHRGRTLISRTWRSLPAAQPLESSLQANQRLSGSAWTVIPAPGVACTLNGPPVGAWRRHASSTSHTSPHRFQTRATSVRIVGGHG